MNARFVVVFLLGLGMVSSGQQPEPARKQQGNARAQTNQATGNVSSANPPVTVYNVEQAPPEPPATNPDKTGREKFVDGLYDPIAWLTLALLIMAILDFAHYVSELRDTRLTNRAHVAVEEIELKGMPDKPLALTVKLRNTGRLPATLLAVSQTLIIERPIEDKPDLSRWLPVGGVVPPDGIAYSGGKFGAPNEDVFLDIKDWPRIKTGDCQILVYGAIRYKDGFGDERETAFGFRYDHTLTDRAAGHRLVCINTPGFNYMT